MTQYLQIYKKYTELQNKIKQDISAKEKEESKDKNRQLRRSKHYGKHLNSFCQLALIQDILDLILTFVFSSSVLSPQSQESKPQSTKPHRW